MTKNKRIIIIVSLVAFLLLIPIVAMQFTDQVSWTLFDFLIAAFLLLSAGFTIDYIIREVKGNKYRIALFLAILATLLLIWAELAIGILGTPLSGH